MTKTRFPKGERTRLVDRMGKKEYASHTNFGEYGGDGDMNPVEFCDLANLHGKTLFRLYKTMAIGDTHDIAHDNDDYFTHFKLVANNGKHEWIVKCYTKYYDATIPDEDKGTWEKGYLLYKVDFRTLDEIGMEASEGIYQ